MAAARRAYWKGYLKLSLVTCPVAPVSLKEMLRENPRSRLAKDHALKRNRRHS